MARITAVTGASQKPTRAAVTETDFTAALKAEASRLGFADCRVTGADAIPEAAERLRAVVVPSRSATPETA